MSSVSTLHEQVDAYLVARRAMGFDLRIDERQLRAFARFADHEGHRGPVTLALAVRWAQSARGSTRLTWARRLQTLRPFTKYHAVLDADTEVVPAGLFGPVARRLVPHIYTETEIAALLEAVGSAEAGHGTAAAPSDVRHLVWLAGEHGVADFRGARTQADRRGPPRCGAHRSTDQISEIPPRAAPSHDGEGLDAICRGASAVRERSGHWDVLDHRSSDAAERAHGRAHVCDPPQAPRMDRPGRLPLTPHP